MKKYGCDFYLFFITKKNLFFIPNRVMNFNFGKF